jgi:hypothetical protein
MIIESIHCLHRHPIGELLVGGDYTSADGDTGTLAHIAEVLSLCVAEPLRTELVPLIRMQRDHLDHAGEEWARVRSISERRCASPELDSAAH